MSMPLSHFVPTYPSPSPCPQVHSLCLCLYYCPAPRFFRTIFLSFFFGFHIYVLAYGICFSLSDLLHSVWQTLGPSTSLQITQFRFFLSSQYFFHLLALVYLSDTDIKFSQITGFELSANCLIISQRNHMGCLVGCVAAPICRGEMDGPLCYRNNSKEFCEVVNQYPLPYAYGIYPHEV